MNALIFPQYSGWLHIKTGFFETKRAFFILCNGRLNYYEEDWRKTFNSGDIDQKENKFEVTPIRGASFKIDKLTLTADSETCRNRWIRELEHAASEEENVDLFIDDCRRQLENASIESLPDILNWVTGILTILKDARTTREDIAYIGNHLANTGFVDAIVHGFKFTLRCTKTLHLTNALLETVASSDDCDDVDKILYITRRLIWRLSFASKAFAFTITSTDYLHYVVQDLKQVSLSPKHEWQDGNYLIFSALDVIQQCARSGVNKERLYEFGGVYTIASILRESSSNIEKTRDGFIWNFNNLSREDTVVLFNQEVSFRLLPHLEAYDADLDYAVLTLNPDLDMVLPPPLVPVSTYDIPDRLAAVIGFGHTRHDQKTVDPHVPILPSSDEQLRQADKWVQDNEPALQECLRKNGENEYKVSEAYGVLNRADKICIRSTLEKGGSGSPGILFTPNGPRVFTMLQGGLPSFYWALPHELSVYIPLACRVEYGISMWAIQKHIEEVWSPDIRKDIFGD